MGLERGKNGAGTRIKSIYTTVAILEAIRNADGATLTELTERLDIPKSTIYHHLSTVCDCQFVRKEGMEYVIGHRFLTFAGPAREREEIYASGVKEVDKLANRAEKNAQIVVEENGRGVYIYHSKEDYQSDVTPYIGTVVDLHCTAAGKAILAHKPRADIHEWIEQFGLTRKTENTVTSKDALFDELETIQQQEVAFDDEEWIDGVRCIAAPVISETDEILGAVSVSAPTDQMNDELFYKELPNLVQNTTGVIEANTSYSSWSELSNAQADPSR